MTINLNGISSAFRTLTVIPWPGSEQDDLASSLPWFPVVGLSLGLILYAFAQVWALIPFIQWTGGAALLLLGSEVWLTRGLHLDGLADWADSVGGSPQRERRLEIMKDLNLGAFGVLALVLVLMAKWVAFERLFSSGSIVWLMVILSLSRSMMVELITTLPYARSGEGTARAFVQGSSPGHRRISHLISLGICLFLGPMGLVLFGSAWIITRLFRDRCKKQFEGITGDLLGTANEFVETFLLMVCAIPGKNIVHYTGWAWVC